MVTWVTRFFPEETSACFGRRTTSWPIAIRMDGELPEPHRECVVPNRTQPAEFAGPGGETENRPDEEVEGKQEREFKEKTESGRKQKERRFIRVKRTVFKKANIEYSPMTRRGKDIRSLLCQVVLILRDSGQGLLVPRLQAVTE